MKLISNIKQKKIQNNNINYKNGAKIRCRMEVSTKKMAGFSLTQSLNKGVLG